MDTDHQDNEIHHMHMVFSEINHDEDLRRKQSDDKVEQNMEESPVKTQTELQLRARILKSQLAGSISNSPDVIKQGNN